MLDIDKDNTSDSYRALVADKLRRMSAFWIDEVISQDESMQYYVDTMGQDMIALISFLLETRHKGE